MPRRLFRLNPSSRLPVFKIRSWKTLPQYLISSYGNQIDDFEAASGWEVQQGNTPTDNVTEYKTGSQSVKLDTTGAALTKIDKHVNWDLSSSYILQFWIYWHVGTGSAESITVYLNNANSHSTWSNYARIDLAGLMLWSGWNCIRVHRNYIAETGINWANPIQVIRLQFANTTGNHAYSFDNLRSHVTGYGGVTISFDDTYATDYTAAYPALNSHNTRGTSFCIGNNLGSGGRLSDAQLAALDAAGWTVGNHSQTHPYFNTLTQAQIETELSDCADEVVTHGGGSNGHYYHAYPYGVRDADSDAAMTAQGFRYGRGTETFPAALETVDPFRIPGLPYVNLANSITYLNLVKSRCYLGGLSFHSVSIADIHPLLNYIASHGIYCLTFDEVYQLSQGSCRVRKPI